MSADSLLPTCINGMQLKKKREYVDRTHTCHLEDVGEDVKGNLLSILQCLHSALDTIPADHSKSSGYFAVVFSLIWVHELREYE